MRINTVGLATSILLLVAVVSLAPATHAQQETPTTRSSDGAEEAAWKDVNCFATQSLQSFIQAFPSGKHTQDANDALELNNHIQKIRDGKEDVKFAIQFEDLGGGDAWAASGDVGFTGKGIHRMAGDLVSMYAFFPPMGGGKTPGIDVISFDGNGNPRVSVTDGSIVAFATDGVDLVFYGGAKFRTPGNIPAFFAVIKGKGFVHLKGAVSVTVKGKEPVELKDDAQVNAPGIGASKQTNPTAPTTDPSQRSQGAPSVQRIGLISFGGVAVLALGALLWQRGRKS